jgi:outer membrane protein TolC
MKKFFINYCITISLLPIFAFGSAGSNTLTLKDAIDIAMLKSPSVEVSNLQGLIDRFSLELSHYAYMPQYNLHANYTMARGSDDSYTIGPTVTLKSLHGTNSSLSISQNKSSGDTYNNINLAVNQPLIKGSNYEINRIELDNAIDQDKVNYLGRADNVAAVINGVQSAYFKIIQDYKQRDILNLTLHSSEDILQQYKIKVKAGLLPESSISQQNSQVISNKLQIETNNNAIKSDYRDLMLLMGLKGNEKFTLDLNTSFSAPKLPSLAEAIVVAKEHNYDYVQNKIKINSAQRSLLKAEDNNKWDLSIDGNVNNYGAKSIALNASIPIADFTLKAEIETAKIHLMQQQILLNNHEDSLVAETTNLWNNLLTRQKQIELSKINVEYSEKNYRNAIFSQMHGKSSAYDVVLQEKSYLQSKLDVINYEMSYYVELASFNKFLGIVLENWNVSLRK